MLTQKRLKEVLSYDKNTGLFTWIKSCGAAGKGSIAGNVNDAGYIRIRIDNQSYRAHRLAWLYCLGYFPENQIDHININPADNRFKNLREVSQSCNVRNTGNRKNNTSGIKGVSYCNTYKIWTSQISIGKKSYKLGNHKSFDDAVCTRLAAEQFEDWHGCYNSSPAYKYVKKHIQTVVNRRTEGN